MSQLEYLSGPSYFHRIFYLSNDFYHSGIAEETAPRDTAKDTGPSTSGAVNDTTDHDLAESTKKVHLKDKIKEKLHFRKKSEST